MLVVRMPVKHGDANADGERRVDLRSRAQAQGGQVAAQAFGHGHRNRFIGLDQQDQKLVIAHSKDEITCAQAVDQCIGQLGQDQVARFLPNR